VSDARTDDGVLAGVECDRGPQTQRAGACRGGSIAQQQATRSPGRASLAIGALACALTTPRCRCQQQQGEARGGKTVKGTHRWDAQRGKRQKALSDTHPSRSRRHRVAATGSRGSSWRANGAAVGSAPPGEGAPAPPGPGQPYAGQRGSTEGQRAAARQESAESTLGGKAARGLLPGPGACSSGLKRGLVYSGSLLRGVRAGAWHVRGTRSAVPAPRGAQE
jgi:hypothetical protein